MDLGGSDLRQRLPGRFWLLFAMRNGRTENQGAEYASCAKGIKMNRTRFCVTILAVLVICNSVPASGRHQAPKETDLTRGNIAFALGLYRSLAKQDENLLVSPYSLSAVMVIAYSGARDETQKEIGNVLHFPTRNKDAESQVKVISAEFGILSQAVRGNLAKQGYELSSAVSLWAQHDYEFLPQFLEQSQKYFYAGLNRTDFRKSPDKIQKEVNAWVSKRTSNAIRELDIPDIKNPLNMLLVCSAVYFKGTWAVPFQKEQTKPAEFRVSEDKKVKVEMMHQEEVFEYAEVGDVRVLDLRYFGTERSFEGGVPNEVSMIVLLPETDDGLAALEQNLTPELLDEYLAKTGPTQVDVFLPRFKIQFEANLTGNLQKMGIHAAFDGLKADFSGIDGKKHWMYLGPVVHKACVEVDEVGTIAAASSAGLFRVLGSVGPGVFKADHPFLFIIRHNRTGSVLFIGRVVNPKE